MNSNDTLGRAIGSVLAKLNQARDEAFTWPSPNSGLAIYAMRQASISPTIATAQAAATDCVVQPNSPLLAALGYRIAVDDEYAVTIATQWLMAIDRLAEKDPFPADRQSFGFRPVELLGITLGLKQVGDESKIAWIREVLAKAADTQPTDKWARMLLVFAGYKVGVSVSCTNELKELTVTELGLRRWLADSGIPGLPLSRELDDALLQACLVEPINADECDRAAVLAISLEAATRRSVSTCIQDNWAQDWSRQTAEEAVVQLCRRFHVVARQMRVRYAGRVPFELNDEYDVQYLLKAMLAIHFEDVRPEEYTPSYAGKSTRMDFLLKKEGIVVEAKMTRAGLSDKEVASQLIDDKERYRAHSDCRTLVCLVYDPNGYIKNARGLEADLSGDDGVLRTLVIINPIGM